MKISVILAHPDRNSFNHVIAQTVTETLKENRHQIFYHDLYDENFDPLLPGKEIFKETVLPEQIEKHCNEIAMAEGIIIVHPNWWGQPPAILKGWIDRVIRPGIAYEFIETDKGDGVPNGLLAAKSAIVFNTSNTPTKRELEVFKDPLETIWKNCIFDLCGVKKFYRKMFNIMVLSTPRQRQDWLDDVRRTINEFYPDTHLG